MSILNKKIEFQTNRQKKQNQLHYQIIIQSPYQNVLSLNKHFLLVINFSKNLSLYQKWLFFIFYYKPEALKKITTIFQTKINFAEIAITLPKI